MEHNNEEPPRSGLATVFELCGMLVLAAALAWRIGKRTDSQLMHYVAAAVAGVAAAWMVGAGLKVLRNRGGVVAQKEALRYVGLLLAAVAMTVGLIWNL